MYYKKIIYVIILAIFSSQVFADSWRPNQVGSFLSSKIARSMTDIENSAYFAEYSYNRNPDSFALGVIALEALITNGQIIEALPIGLKISKNMPEITLAQYISMIDSLNSNSYSKVLDILLNISPNGIDNFILPILQTWAAAGSNKELGGLEIMKGQANRGVLDPLYDYQSALIYEFIGDIENAHISYKNIIKRSNNANAHVYSRAAIFFANNNLQDLYTETLNKLETIDPYSNELFILKKNENYTNKTKITNIKQGISEVFLNSAEILFNEGLDRQALIYAQISSYLEPKSDSANYLLGRIFKSINSNERAIKYFKKVNEYSLVIHDANIAYAETLYDIEGLSNSKEFLNNMKKSFPDNINYLRTMAELFYKAKDFKSSIQYYDLIFEKIDRIEFKHWPLFYSSGIALERGNNWERAEKQFLTALQFVPNNPQVLNYLGYSWIDQGVNINRALEMIVNAAEQRPDDGYIIDSLGWAYFQIGNYEEAVINLEKAVALVSDSVIIDHLGDALFYSGRKVEAVFQWKRALEFNPSEELIKILNDKIDGDILPKAGVNAVSKPI